MMWKSIVAAILILTICHLGMFEVIDGRCTFASEIIVFLVYIVSISRGDPRFIAQGDMYTSISRVWDEETGQYIQQQTRNKVMYIDFSGRHTRRIRVALQRTR